MQDAASNTISTHYQPQLRWKHKPRNRRILEVAGETAQFTTLKEAFEFIDRRDENNVLVLTRMSSGWSIYQYRANFLCRPHFNEIIIGGLPLGGDPLNPHTLVIDGSGRLARIVRRESAYELKATDRPSEEPSGPWVNSIVPVKEHNNGWSVTWLPKFTFRPTLNELQAMQIWINQNLPAGTKIKAGGAQHSWSQITNTDDVYVQHDRMKLFRTLDEEPNVYRAGLGERRRNLIRAGSGSNVREANRYLWNHGKSFIALPGYDAQTMGGIFNTGTHGSTFTVGPLAEFILSIDLLRSDATYVRIEPKDGITDPAAFARERPDMELIQDDDWFYSNIINMGTMGIVHSYVLEVTERYHLKEVRTGITVDDMKAKLKGGKIYKLSGVEGKPAELGKVKLKISDGKDGGFKNHPLPAFHLELLFNPHGNKIIVTSRHPVEVKDDSVFSFEPPGRDLVRTFLMGTRFSRPAIPTWIQDRFRRALICIINKIVHTVPSATPFLIDRAMDTLLDKAYIDRSFNVFNFGQGISRIPALAGTIFIPLENDIYLDALDIVFAVAKRFAARKLYETAPISMRFVKATKALIGCPKDYCAFEFIFTASTTYAQDMFEAYVKALREKFGGEVRLHWGQMLPDFDPEQIRAMYSRYDIWRGVRDELDPQERFLNEWQAENLPSVGS